jgi:hypothetical protein
MQLFFDIFLVIMAVYYAVSTPTAVGDVHLRDLHWEGAKLFLVTCRWLLFIPNVTDGSKDSNALVLHYRTWWRRFLIELLPFWLFHHLVLRVLTLVASLTAHVCLTPFYQIHLLRHWRSSYPNTPHTGWYELWHNNVRFCFLLPSSSLSPVCLRHWRLPF